MFSRLHWEKFGIYRKNSQKREFLVSFKNCSRMQYLVYIAILVPPSNRVMACLLSVSFSVWSGQDTISHPYGEGSDCFYIHIVCEKQAYC